MKKKQLNETEKVNITQHLFRFVIHQMMVIFPPTDPSFNLEACRHFFLFKHLHRHLYGDNFGMICSN